MTPESENAKKIADLEFAIKNLRSQVEQLKRSDVGKFNVELEKIWTEIKILKEGGNI